MLLRESARVCGEQVDLAGLTDPETATVKGVPHAETLLRFVDALVRREEELLDHARVQLQDEMGAACMVDAAGVASSFQRMVRIADATGIPLDDPMLVMSEDLRAELGINDYVAAANTRQMGTLKKLLLKVMGPRMMRRIIDQHSAPR